MVLATARCVRLLLTAIVVVVSIYMALLLLAMARSTRLTSMVGSAASFGPPRTPELVFERLCGEGGVLPQVYRDAIRSDMAHWKGRTFKLSEVKAAIDRLREDRPGRFEQVVGLWKYHNHKFTLVYGYLGAEGFDFAEPWREFMRALSLPLSNMQFADYADDRVTSLMKPTYFLLNSADFPVCGAGDCPLRAELEQFHSFDHTPVRFRFDVPVLSAAKVPGCQHDILIPFQELMGGGDWVSPVQRLVTYPLLRALHVPESWFEPNRNKYRSSKAWSERSPVMGWRGVNSGGGQHTGHSHRLRVVQHCREREHELALQRAAGSQSAQPMYDVGFSEITLSGLQGAPQSFIDGLKKEVSGYMPMSEQRNRWKYVLDMDSKTFSIRLPFFLSMDLALVRMGYYEDVLSRAAVNGTDFYSFRPTPEGFVALDDMVTWFQTHDTEALEQVRQKQHFYEQHGSFDIMRLYSWCVFHAYTDVVSFEEDVEFKRLPHLQMYWLPLPLNVCITLIVIAVVATMVFCYYTRVLKFQLSSSNASEPAVQRRLDDADGL